VNWSSVHWAASLSIKLTWRACSLEINRLRASPCCHC
jgi:hypothetical protein